MALADYFEVVSTKDQVFQFRLKGFWSDDVADQIEAEFVAAFKASVDKMAGKKFIAFGDSTKLKPLSEKGQAVMGKAMGYARTHNLVKSVQIMPSAVTRIAIHRVAEKTGEDDFRIVVSSEEEGWEKINELKKTL